MKLVKRFKVETHEDYGCLGLRPLWLTDADPLGGMAAAHDMLEHFPNEPGPVEGEFMALGASLYIRGNGGYPYNGSPASNLASDLPNIWMRVGRGDQSFGTRGRGRTHRLEDSWMEDEIQDTITEFHKLWRSDFEDNGRFPNAREQKLMIDWMRRGYRKAQRRYAGTNACNVCALFMKIEERVDIFLKREGRDCEGATVRICANTDGSNVYLDEEYGQ